MRALFFDTETTGLPKDRKKDATQGANNWPDPVSIAWIVTEDSKPVRAKYYIVQPKGWQIPEDSIKIHGITQRMAETDGVPLNHILGEFMRDLRQVDVAIAHNLEFDKNVILAAVLYHCKDDIAMKWPRYEFCTCEGARDITKLPLLRPTLYFKFKSPKLSELYEYTFKSSPPESILHTSLGDTQILVAIFFKLWTLEKVCEVPKRTKSHLQEITAQV
jgi:DNA polymerase III epsilon subunit-like protein